MGCVQVRAHGNVLSHSLRRKGLHDLKGARHAALGIEVRLLPSDVMAFKNNAAMIGQQKS